MNSSIDSRTIRLYPGASAPGTINVASPLSGGVRRDGREGPDLLEHDDDGVPVAGGGWCHEGVV